MQAADNASYGVRQAGALLKGRFLAGPEDLFLVLWTSSAIYQVDLLQVVRDSLCLYACSALLQPKTICSIWGYLINNALRAFATCMLMFSVKLIRCETQKNVDKRHISGHRQGGWMQSGLLGACLVHVPLCVSANISKSHFMVFAASDASVQTKVHTELPLWY